MSSIFQAQAEKSWSAYEDCRIGMTVGFRDADPPPKGVGSPRATKKSCVFHHLLGYCRKS